VPRKLSQKQLFKEEVVALIPKINEAFIEKLWKSFTITGLLTKTNHDEVIETLSNRLIFMDYEDYNQAFEYQLPLCGKLTKHLMSNNMNRDNATILINSIQGCLAEFAVQRFLLRDYGLKVTLDYSENKRLEKYVPSDISSVVVNGIEVPSSANVSVKSTKFGGAWLDIQGKQIEKSDYFTLALVGVDSGTFLHFISLKHTFMPNTELFTPIPVLLMGMISRKDERKRPKVVKVKQKKSTLIKSYDGHLTRNKSASKGYTLEGVRERKVTFACIEKFSEADHYIASIDRLDNSEKAWKELASAISPKVALGSSMVG
jgi:hypothetical protein